MRDHETPLARYRSLWAAVLARAIKDAVGEQTGPEARLEARRWLHPRNPDLAFVCEAAGVPRARVVRWVRLARRRQWQLA